MSDISRGSLSVVGILFAISGEYEDYRARSCGVYESVDVAQKEADRRNALALAAKEKHRVTWDEPDEEWASTERKQKRILNKLRKETTDAGIESHDIGDLTYSVTEERFIPA